jgi:predicted RNase H-like HicB family nuclease
MTRDFHVIIERDAAGYYVASVPGLPGCHTQAKSMAVLMKRVREAIALCLDDLDGAEEASEFIGIQRITVNA